MGLFFLNNNKVATSTPNKGQKIIKSFQKGNVSGIFIAFGVSLLLVALVALIFGQRIGYQQGISYADEKAKKEADGEEVSSRNIKALKLKTQVLQGQLETAEQERDISLNNLADLRENLQKLEVTNLQLRQNNEVYTKVLAEQGGIPLQIIGAKIAPLPENAYEYRFDVAMLDKNNQSKKLTVTLTLLDEVNMVDVPLEPKTYDIHGVARIRGRFLMPKGFNPKQAKLEIQVDEEIVEQIYNWQLGKPVDNMPYSLEETPATDHRPIDGEVKVTSKVEKQPNEPSENSSDTSKKTSE